ncbi:MAG: inositol-3-phosphate synthase [Planctomycetota bacterium]|jgi:myo-inositol-1-phosphate synthase
MAKRTKNNAGSDPRRLGLWMIGACGGIGSTVALGVSALRKGLIPPTGMVSALPEFGGLALADPAHVVVGGCEIRNASLIEAVRESHIEASLFDSPLIEECQEDLKAFQRNIRSGTLCGTSRPVKAMADRDDKLVDGCPAAAIERLAGDIERFRRRHRLDGVVVVHVASAEPSAPAPAAHGSWSRLQKTLNRRGSRVLPASSIYALAALEAGCPFVNFTPSLGIGVPAIMERADELGLPYMGNDGKTGESLVKSFLAPMFALRNLEVLSWVGQNILGNRDGQILTDPKTREAKIRSKDGLLTSLDGKRTTRRVSIDYVPSLQDWKVAWDFIHFEGFLGTKMNLQFTWHGSDSVLAAPLVLDLALLMDFAQRQGQSGPQSHLACFFKSPIGVDDHGYEAQWQLLRDYAIAHGAESFHAL